MPEPRKLSVVVEATVRGMHCSTLCDFLGFEEVGARCSLFGAYLSLERRAGVRRCPKCLALDEPERTPEEAYAHGMGAQDG